MTTFKKQEIAMYVTGGLSLLILGLITGAWLDLFQILAVAGGIIFVVFSLYKIIYFILDKVCANGTTITKGGTTTTINYNCENRN